MSKRRKGFLDRLRRRICSYRGHPAHILTPFCMAESFVSQSYESAQDQAAAISNALGEIVRQFLSQPASQRFYCPDCDRKFGYLELIERSPLW